MITATGFSLIFLIARFSSVLSVQWEYGEENKWPGLCQQGKEQSPIDLDTSNSAIQVDAPFEFVNYDIPHKATVKNDGHSVTITLEAANETPTISGAGLTEEYLLHHMHFHWQSEHTVNGFRYPLEMHLVHYAKVYGSLDEAVKYPGGLAVLGVLFDLTIDDDDDFIALIEVMQNVVEYPDSEAQLQGEIKALTYLPRNTGEYFRYQGSLTTPMCDEGVIWTVFLTTVPISGSQVRNFELVWSDNGPLTLNYRSIQPLNGRHVIMRTLVGKNPTLRSAAAELTSLSLLVIIIFTVIAAKLC